MASLDRVGRILPGLLPLFVLVSCTATAVSAPAAVNPAPRQARGAPSAAAVDLRIAFTESSGGNAASAAPAAPRARDRHNTAPDRLAGRATGRPRERRHPGGGGRATG